MSKKAMQRRPAPAQTQSPYTSRETSDLLAAPLYDNSAWLDRLLEQISPLRIRMRRVGT
jgi:hypothetical protein